MAPALTCSESHQLQHFCKQPGQGINRLLSVALRRARIYSQFRLYRICKLIFLLAAIKIKDLGIYCKRYYQFYVLAFLSYDQGINPAFSACL